MRFKNPKNGYEKEASGAFSWLWCLIFNWAYFVAKGNYRHAIIYGFITIPSFGLACLIYPLLVYRINDEYYRRNGWIEVSPKNKARYKH